MTRFILAAVLSAVVVADGITLIGFTSAVPGNAAPMPAPIVGGAAPALPSAPPSAPPSEPPDPSAAVPPDPAAPVASPKPNPTTRSRPQPEPPRSNRVEDDERRPAYPTKSPFEDRCRSGEIPAWLCREIPD